MFGPAWVGRGIVAGSTYPAHRGRDRGAIPDDIGRSGQYVRHVASTDKAIRAIVTTAYRRVAEWLVPNLTESDVVKLEDTSLIASELQADAIISIDDGRVIHVEFQGYPDPTIARRMAIYGTRILEKYGTYPAQFLIGVHPAAGTLPSEFTAPNFVCRWQTIDLWTHPSQDVLPHVPELAVLARPDRDDPATLFEAISEWIDGIGDPNERSKSIALINTLAATRYRRQDVESWLRRNIMGNAGIIERSWYAQRLINEGREAGRVEGREVGRVEGREVGRVEGRVEGEHMGQLKLVRAFIDQNLRPFPSDLLERIDQLPTHALDDLAVRLFSGATATDVKNWLDDFDKLSRSTSS